MNKMEQPKEHKMYRFDLSQPIIDEIKYFAQVHELDDKKDFKENWEKWCNENEQLINNEYKRLQQLGYQGNLESKMYFSCRYYYRVKKDIGEKQKIERKKYQKLNEKIVQEINKHVKNIGKNEKPSIAFDDFCQKCKSILDEEITNYNRDIESNEILCKIKKTYKNKHFEANKSS